MRRITKRLIKFIIGVAFTVIYCEYLLYYVLILQCSWPEINSSLYNEEPLKALIIADTHLLGPWRGHWLDKLRREWQMHRAFQAIMTTHQPEVVFVLGDLFDEGEWTNHKQFQEYVDRFYRLFPVPKDTSMHVVAGNHDIGFHNNIRRGSTERFTKLLNSSSVQLITIKNNHFVLINSMAMEGDKCSMCTKARNDVKKISGILKCAENPALCYEGIKKVNNSRPILMQHFPLYRKSDAVCTEPDAPPLPERNKLFRSKIDALSKDATDFLVSYIKPRVAFGGHTHHGCLLHHKYSEDIEFDEHSVPSFSWRNRPEPKYMLVSLTPGHHAVSKCSLPKEATIAITFVVMIILVIWFARRQRLLRN